MRIKKGDTVIVIAGNDKGQTGEVSQVLSNQNRIVVAGINTRTKHQKPRQAGRSQVQGGIVEFEAPIDISNIMLVCPHTGEPTRIGVRRDENGKPVRFSKKSGKDI